MRHSPRCVPRFLMISCVTFLTGAAARNWSRSRRLQQRSPSTARGRGNRSLSRVTVRAGPRSMSRPRLDSASSRPTSRRFPRRVWSRPCVMAQASCACMQASIRPRFRSALLPARRHAGRAFAGTSSRLLSKAGCNAGACHGNFNGKGGLRLSLRGDDPVFDLQVLTRDGLGRRVCLAAPATSLSSPSRWASYRMKAGNASRPVHPKPRH